MNRTRPYNKGGLEHARAGVFAANHLEETKQIVIPVADHWPTIMRKIQNSYDAMVRWIGILVSCIFLVQELRNDH